MLRFGYGLPRALIKRCQRGGTTTCVASEMKKLLRLAIIFCSLSGLLTEGFASEKDVVKTLPDKTPDGRFNSRCMSWGNEVSREFCTVSFYRLLATPEKYHDRLIAVTGYLIKLFNRPVLFVNRNSYEADADYEGIVLIDAKIPDEIKSKMNEGVWPVVVVGVFDAKYTGAQVHRLGALRDIQNIALVEKYPSVSNGSEE